MQIKPTQRNGITAMPYTWSFIEWEGPRLATCVTVCRHRYLSSSPIWSLPKINDQMANIVSRMECDFLSPEQCAKQLHSCDGIKGETYFDTLRFVSVSSNIRGNILCYVGMKRETVKDFHVPNMFSTWNNTRACVTFSLPIAWQGIIRSHWINSTRMLQMEIFRIFHSSHTWHVSYKYRNSI